MSLNGSDSVRHALDIVSSGVMAALDRPTEQVRGLPNAAFTSEAFLAAENARLFPRTWMFAGIADDVPNTGDVQPVQVAGRSLFLTRGDDGEIRVFHNVCPHRGARLVVEPMNGARALTCPYHAWSFDLDGALKGRPHYHGPERHDRGANGVGLFEVRSAQWHDWVFVNLDGKAPEFDAYMGPAFARYQGWNLNAFERAHYAAFEFRCNWKLAIENFCDIYHVFKVHPALHDMQSTEDRFAMEPDGHHMFAWFTMAGEGRGLTLDPDGPVLPEVDNLPDELRTRSPYCNLFPNSAMAIFPSNLQFVNFEPIGVDHCRMHQWYYFAADAARAPEHRDAREQVYAEWANLNAEDEGICRRLQEGRSCDDYDGGRLAPYWDTGTVHFQRQVAQAVRAEGAFART